MSGLQTPLRKLSLKTNSMNIFFGMILQEGWTRTHYEAWAGLKVIDVLLPLQVPQS